MRVRWRAFAPVAVSAAAITIAFAQTGATFEVAAAIQTPGRYVLRGSRTPQRIAFRAALVGDVMAFAYGFPLDRIERLPQWMYDEPYDVAVTTAAPAGLPEQKVMLQKLLEQRFGLMVHRISNPSPVYYLVAGANVNLPEAKAAEAGELPDLRLYPFQGLATSSPTGPAGLVYASRHVAMSELADWLYSQVKLPVLDKTGMTGFYDIEIPGMPIRGGAEGTIRAVRNALGLELESHRGIAESLIIDHVERPSGN